MRTADFIEAAKKRLGISSDYALAKQLHTGQTTVTSWKSGRSVPDARFSFKLADLAGVDPVTVLASIELERAERIGSEDAASYWRDYLRRIGDAPASIASRASKAAGAAITGIFLGALLTAPPPVNASSISPGKTAQNANSDSVYYVNRRRRKKDRRRSGVMAGIARTLWGYSALN